jgi:SEC-C motif-containing protein
LKSTICHCGSGADYAACCSRYHGGEPAPDAQTLMRSRYAAFVMMNEPYLLATWHASTRARSVTFEPGLKWLGLKVVSARETGTDKAEVEFIARFRVGGGSASRHHELSRFVFETGRWFYVDGDLVASD